MKSKVTNEDVTERHYGCVCFGKSEALYDFAIGHDNDVAVNCSCEYIQDELEAFFKTLDVLNEENKWALENFNMFKETDLYKLACFF